MPCPCSTKWPKGPQPPWDVPAPSGVGKGLLGEPRSASHTVVLDLWLKASHCPEQLTWAGHPRGESICVNEDLGTLGSWSVPWN